jgi:hypothetical protein
MPSEISGLDDLRGFLKYGNHVARFSFPFIALEEKHPGYLERDMDDLIVSSEIRPTDPEPQASHALVPENIGEDSGIDEGME